MKRGNLSSVRDNIESLLAERDQLIKNLETSYNVITTLLERVDDQQINVNFMTYFLEHLFNHVSGEIQVESIRDRFSLLSAIRQAFFILEPLSRANEVSFVFKESSKRYDELFRAVIGNGYQFI